MSKHRPDFEHTAHLVAPLGCFRVLLLLLQKEMWFPLCLLPVMPLLGEKMLFPQLCQSNYWCLLCDLDLNIKNRAVGKIMAIQSDESTQQKECDGNGDNGETRNGGIPENVFATEETCSQSTTESEALCTHQVELFWNECPLIFIKHLSSREQKVQGITIKSYIAMPRHS